MAAQVKPRIISIVDDDESVRGSLLDLMNSIGLAAEAFPTAEDFLASGRQNNTACLIADIRMPGMSGLDLQAKLKSRQYRIPIIFITAHGDEKLRIRAMRAGAAAFLEKPFDSEVLMARVRACLDA